MLGVTSIKAKENLDELTTQLRQASNSKIKEKLQVLLLALGNVLQDFNLLCFLTKVVNSLDSQSYSFPSVHLRDNIPREVLGTESVTDLFPLVSKLMVHALVLPMSTTDCESCFSTRNESRVI